MSLHEQIKRDNVAALKAGDKTKRGVYTLLLGEVARTGDPSAEITDAQIITAAQKIAGGISELLSHGVNDAELPKQLEILNALIPKAATENDLIDFVAEYVQNNPGLTTKDMGLVMGELKAKFAVFDGKVASGIVRTAISELK